MNENATKLAAALRSGEFQQASGMLRTEKGYCCLGVACELYARETDVQWDRDYDGDWLFLAEVSYLPTAVQEWLGFRGKRGEYREVRSLADHNDSGDTFATIADIIEAEPGGLFV